MEAMWIRHPGQERTIEIKVNQQDLFDLTVHGIVKTENTGVDGAPIVIYVDSDCD